MDRDTATSTFTEFVQHVGIAEVLLADFSSYRHRVKALSELGAASPQILRDMAREAQLVWERLWAQLAEARAIAAAAGRDVSGFDDARDQAAAILGTATSVEVGEWELGFFEVSRTSTWRTASEDPARQAIEALRDAIPEAVIPQPSQAPVVDVRGAFPWIGLVVAFGMLVAVVIWIRA